ncbi:hypothetical protein [Streptomyces coelicoflavus]|uniref:Sensor domain-containing protein n=1 Tax=Streptomyces coelicoflavus TaxID=285562 RepID=A0A6N9URN8_9ACTN|nr:hypothetical protein [Streptomyces coelicoflavus]NEB18933.1 hypothetical protein [Streptomyces coelicoflavus]
MQARTTRLTTRAAATFIGLALASGCATAQEPEVTAEVSPTTPSATTPSARARAEPLTTAQLKDLAFKDGEVPQAHEPLSVQAPPPEGSERSFPPISVPACRPLIDVRSGEGSFAHVFQVFNWKKNIMGGSSTLASYEGDEAEQRFAALRQALTTCRSYEGEGYAGPFEVTVRTETPPQVGEEALAFLEISPVESDSLGDSSEQFIVVRTGNTIATFSELSVGADLSFPTELIRRQVKRLKDAQQP